MLTKKERKEIKNSVIKQLKKTIQIAKEMGCLSAFKGGIHMGISLASHFNRDEIMREFEGIEE